MQVIVAHQAVTRTFFFPDDAEIYFKAAAAGYIQIRHRDGVSSWFNPDYVIAIMPGPEVV